MFDLRLGRWQGILDDVVTVNLLLGDPPYSQRTHEGQRTGSSGDMSTVAYDAMTFDLARQFAALWHRRVTDWVVLFCDHIAFRWHEEAWQALGWETFAPVIWIKPDAAPRKSGDGPQTSAEHIFVTRPKGWPKVRSSRPGWYECPTSELRGCGLAGSKPLALIRALVRDYSSSNDLIVDPYAGRATTLLAAAIECRKSIGAECDSSTYALAQERLAKGYSVDLLAAHKARLPKPKQEALL